MTAEVYRAPMRSRIPGVDEALAPERAVELGLCGVGGRLGAVPGSATEAVARTAEEYDERTARRLERFQAVPVGSVVWTRDPSGFYLAGTLTGEWRYDDDPAAHAADLVHVRDCTWQEPLAEHRAPAAVVATYRRGGRNFQRIRGAEA